MEKKQQFTLEYPINSTAASLFAKLSSEGGLESWFADKVLREETQFTFIWNKFPHTATLVSQKANRYVRFKWNDDTDPEYFFEFRIVSYELTGSISFVVTDFADTAELDDITYLWENNIKNLRRSLGAGN